MKFKNMLMIAMAITGISTGTQAMNRSSNLTEEELIAVRNRFTQEQLEEITRRVHQVEETAAIAAYVTEQAAEDDEEFEEFEEFEEDEVDNQENEATEENEVNEEREQLISDLSLEMGRTPDEVRAVVESIPPRQLTVVELDTPNGPSYEIFEEGSDIEEG